MSKLHLLQYIEISYFPVSIRSWPGQVTLSASGAVFVYWIIFTIT